MARVLLVLNALSGGATKSAIEFAGGLAAVGHEFVIAHPLVGSGEEAESVRSLALATVPVHLSWWNRKYTLPLQKRVLHWGWDQLRSGFRLGAVNRLRRAVRDWGIELVHTNTALTPDAALAARVAGVPHVWHVREQIGSGRLFRFWFPDRVLVKVFSILSSAIVANSEVTAQVFRRSGAGNRTRVVYNGVDAREFRPPGRREEVRARWGLREGQPVVGMVANLSSRMKRHDLFLQAAAVVAQQVPSAQFVVVGHDPDREGGYGAEVSYARGLKAMGAQLGLDGRLHWAGFEADVPGVMNALDILVHPCGCEGFGRVVVEAMAAARPVVAAAEGGVVEIVVDGTTGRLVAGDDPEQWADVILGLLRSRGLREAMGASGRCRAVEHFSLARTVELLDQVYREVLLAPSGTRSRPS